MALSADQKKRLRRLQFEISPSDGNESSIEEIERFNGLLERFNEKLEKFDAFFETFKGDVYRMFNDKKREYESKMDGLDGELRKHVYRHRETIKRNFDKSMEAVEKNRTEMQQIKTEVMDNIRVSFSKFGGATMPILLQTETPLYQSGPNQGQPFVADGVTTQYTFYNNPFCITVGGAIMFSGDGYQIVALGSSVWQVTFDNAPMPGQTVHGLHY